MILCQKFFGEPVLITTFVLSGRLYHRSKKDVIRLSMTTVTDVDCLNIITIRLSIVFGDCMQSAEVKSNVFYAIFSSAEPLGSQGELIVHTSTRRPSIRPLFSKIVSETANQSQISGVFRLRNRERKFAHDQDGHHAHIW